MIIFSSSNGYSEFRRISCAVVVITCIGITTINMTLQCLTDFATKKEEIPKNIEISMAIFSS